MNDKNKAEYEALMERIKAIPNWNHEYFCHGQIHFDSYTDWEKIGNEILNFNQRVVEEVERLRKLLEYAQQTIIELRDGEDCDHSVGICWCGVTKLQEEIEEALNTEV